MTKARAEANCLQYGRSPPQKVPRQTSRKFPLPPSPPWRGSLAFQTDRNELACDPFGVLEYGSNDEKRQRAYYSITLLGCSIPLSLFFLWRIQLRHKDWITCDLLRSY